MDLLAHARGFDAEKRPCFILVRMFLSVLQLSKEYSFLDFIYGGLQINFTVSPLVFRPRCFR